MSLRFIYGYGFLPQSIPACSDDKQIIKGNFDGAVSEFKMQRLAGREGRCVTGAFVPVAEYGLREGVDNIGEIAIPRVAKIPLRRMRILTFLRLQDNH